MLNQPLIQHFKGFPSRINPRMYAEAAALYARKVSSRAVAVYQVGNVNYPGLSDLDLLVVVRDAKLDNQQFFSVYNSLPKRFHELFLHQPFIVPYDCLDCLRFTSHINRQLLTGRDVAAAIKADSSRGEAWCRLFEGLCTYFSYFTNAAITGTVRVRHMTAVASSMRFTLAQCDRVQGSDLAITYGAALDRLRNALMIDSSSQATAEQIFDRFYGTFQVLEESVRARLSLTHPADLIGFAKRFLAGEITFPDVDPFWLCQRVQALSAYHRALLQLKFPYGHLFFLAAYGDDISTYRQNRIAAKCLNTYYKFRVALAD